MALTPPNKAGQSLARRGARVRWARLALPIMAAILLSSIALWPEIERSIMRARVGFSGFRAKGIATGMMVDPRFRGLDGQDQPFVISADLAARIGLERVNLTAPKADLTLRSGEWLMASSPRGVYQQHADQLDLAGGVTLYREDGTMLQTDTATVDVHQGAATSADPTHAEGPFGTLDAQGFSLVDKGAVVQFTGPAKLVLRGHE